MKFIVTATRVIEFPDSIHRMESTAIVDEAVTMRQIYDRMAPFESLRVLVPIGELEREQKKG
jgi:hypothetical protein